MSRFLSCINKRSVFLILLVSFVILFINVATTTFVCNSNVSIMISRLQTEKDCWAIFEAITMAVFVVTAICITYALKCLFSSFIKEIKIDSIENEVAFFDKVSKRNNEKCSLQLRI